jgi:hypothetical protein
MRINCGPTGDRWKKLVGVACFVLLTSLLSGCRGGGPTEDPVLRIGDHAAAPATDLSALVDSLLAKDEPDGGCATAAVAAGKDDPAPPVCTSAHGSPGTCTLQLGSFRQVACARRRETAIEELGFTPVLETATVDGKLYHRVCLKGLPDVAVARETAERISSRLGIDYLIRRGG